MRKFHLNYYYFFSESHPLLTECAWIPFFHRWTEDLQLLVSQTWLSGRGDGGNWNQSGTMPTRTDSDCPSLYFEEQTGICLSVIGHLEILIVLRWCLGDEKLIRFWTDGHQNTFTLSLSLVTPLMWSDSREIIYRWLIWIAVMLHVSSVHFFVVCIGFTTETWKKQRPSGLWNFKNPIIWQIRNLKPKTQEYLRSLQLAQSTGQSQHCWLPVQCTSTMKSHQKQIHAVNPVSTHFRITPEALGSEGHIPPMEWKVFLFWVFHTPWCPHFQQSWLLLRWSQNPFINLNNSSLLPLSCSIVFLVHYVKVMEIDKSHKMPYLKDDIPG